VSGFWQMVVFDVGATLAVVVVLLTAPDGPRLRKRRTVRRVNSQLGGMSSRTRALLKEARGRR
jgi:hypothetical protein